VNDINAAIHQRLLEFVVALKSGKLEWSADELVQYVAEKKENANDATLDRALGLGPTARARAALCARIIAGCLGVDLTNNNGRYVFGKPDENSSLIPDAKVVEITKLVSDSQTVLDWVKASDAKAWTKQTAKNLGEELERLYKGLGIEEKPVSGGKSPDDGSNLQYPPAPAIGQPSPTFVQPPWYSRMEAALNAGKHVSLAGPPGGGKSTAPEQYFIKKKQPFVVVNGDAGFRRRDIEGTTEIQNGNSFFKVAEFAAAARAGWGCILNEVNAADPDALMFINGILEVPKMVNIHGKAYPVHPDFRLIVTYNPGLVGTKPLPQAFKDRFFSIKLGFPEKEFLWKMVVANTGVDPHVFYMERLLKYAQSCWDLHVKGSLRYQISPRRLYDTVFLMKTLPNMTLDDAIQSAVVDAVDSATECQTLTTLITTSVN
jgi:nitric oxide reductase NorQ protein